MMAVTRQFIDKSIKLSLEFDDYLVKHPELYKGIPDGAVIVVTLKSDKKFTEDSIAVVKKHPSEQPVIKAEKYKSQWTLMPLELSAT